MLINAARRKKRKTPANDTSAAQQMPRLVLAAFPMPLQNLRDSLRNVQSGRIEKAGSFGLL